MCLRPFGRAVFVAGPAGPTTKTARLSPRYEGKTRGATAVIELLMMGGKTPKTCWAVNKRQDNKLKNCCIRLVTYLSCTTTHGLTNLKFYIKSLAHPVCKMWIIQEPKKVTLWNKRHFEEKNGECAACLKYSVLIVVEKKYIKCNIWRVAVRPSYIWDAGFLKVNWWEIHRNLQLESLNGEVNLKELT